MEKEDNSEILRLLGKLETHIINLILPIQGISNILKSPQRVDELVDLVSKPILIDDRKISQTLDTMKRMFESFEKKASELDIAQAFNEIKYIGNRLNKIEKDIEEMKENGLRKNVHLDLTIDGYKVETRSMEVADRCENYLKMLLDTLSDREAIVLTYKVGLFGNKKETDKKIGEKLGLSSERVRAIKKQTIQKLCMRERQELIKKSGYTEIEEFIESGTLRD